MGSVAEEGSAASDSESEASPSSSHHSGSSSESSSSSGSVADLDTELAGSAMQMRHSLGAVAFLLASSSHISARRGSSLTHSPPQGMDPTPVCRHLRACLSGPLHSERLMSQMWTVPCTWYAFEALPIASKHDDKRTTHTSSTSLRAVDPRPLRYPSLYQKHPAPIPSFGNLPGNTCQPPSSL